MADGLRLLRIQICQSSHEAAQRVESKCLRVGSFTQLHQDASKGLRKGPEAHGLAKHRSQGPAVSNISLEPRNQKRLNAHSHTATRGARSEYRSSKPRAQSGEGSAPGDALTKPVKKRNGPRIGGPHALHTSLALRAMSMHEEAPHHGGESKISEGAASECKKTRP